jgi:hypothetical protein
MGGQPTAVGASVTVLDSNANLGMSVTDNQFFKDVLFVLEVEDVDMIWNAANPSQVT